MTKRLPSIVVEPTDATEVESGELRWPPDEPGSPDAQTGRQSAEAGAAGEDRRAPLSRAGRLIPYFLHVFPGEEQLDASADKDASGAEMQDN